MKRLQCIYFATTSSRNLYSSVFSIDIRHHADGVNVNVRIYGPNFSHTVGYFPSMGEG